MHIHFILKEITALLYECLPSRLPSSSYLQICLNHSPTPVHQFSLAWPHVYILKRNLIWLAILAWHTLQDNAKVGSPSTAMYSHMVCMRTAVSSFEHCWHPFPSKILGATPELTAYPWTFIHKQSITLPFSRSYWTRHSGECLYSWQGVFMTWLVRHCHQHTHLLMCLFV